MYFLPLALVSYYLYKFVQEQIISCLLEVVLADFVLVID